MSDRSRQTAAVALAVIALFTWSPTPAVALAGPRAHGHRAAAPTTTSATKPAAKPAAKPATKPAAKPAAAPATKPAAAPATKPAAAPATKPATRTAPRRVVLLPFSSLTAETKLPELEQVFTQALATVPGVTQVVAPAELRRAAKRARRAGPETCEDDDACLTEFGRLVDADHLVYAEVSTLGTGEVAYLKTIEVAGGREVSATTATFVDPARRQAEARASAYRLLAPNAYVGTLALNVDVAKAPVYLDGRQIGRSPIPAMYVAVGTHALRVTHPQYRDWVRFIDVGFDRVTTLDVDLTAYPVISEEMRQKLRPRPRPTAPSPWYRKPWAIAGMAVTAATLTAVVVVLAADGPDYDSAVEVGF